jgi:hypothetical protein
MPMRVAFTFYPLSTLKRIYFATARFCVSSYTHWNCFKRSQRTNMRRNQHTRSMLRNKGCGIDHIRNAPTAANATPATSNPSLGHAVAPALKPTIDDDGDPP